SAEQLGHLRLRQPHGLSLQPHLDRTVFSFEDDELPSFVHKSRSLRKAWASEIRSVPEIRPCGSCASSREARTACTTLRIASCRASGGTPGFRRSTASSNRLRSTTSSWLSRSGRWPSGPMSSSRSILYPSPCSWSSSALSISASDKNANALLLVLGGNSDGSLRNTQTLLAISVPKQD